MLVIVASRHDPTAQALVTRWRDHDAARLSCEDLSAAGWRHYSGSAPHSAAVVSGQTIAVEQIEGVLTRWPSIYAQELLHIVPADRAYVASEMTAFLIAWLSQLACPVLNRPTATSLLGPSWRREQWVHAAARVGIAVRPVHRRAPTPLPEVAEADEINTAPATVTIVGRRTFGTGHPALADQARRLAVAAGVELLAVQFAGPERNAAFLDADLLPDLSAEERADAVLDYLVAHRQTPA